MENKQQPEIVVVTRHPALIQHLREICPELAGQEIEAIEDAKPHHVQGKVVYGVLPIHLAALTAEYHNVAINAPAELRGKELNIEQVRQYAEPIGVYEVKRKR